MPAGFIHDKLDVKLLVLYLLARAEAPVDFATLTDLVTAERGADYFLFAEAAAELAHSGHLAAGPEGYAITDKGRRNAADSGSSLPLVVRRRCDRRLARLNAHLRRQAQVRAALTPREEGGFTLRLDLEDGGGSLLALELLVPTQTEGEAMAGRFRDCPEAVYHRVLSALLGQEGDGE